MSPLFETPQKAGRWTRSRAGQLRRWLSNAAFPEQHADVTKPQVLELLNSNTASALDLIRGLSDEQLQRGIGGRDQQALLQWCGEARTVDQLIEQLLIGHVLLHRSSVRATVGR